MSIITVGTHLHFRGEVYVVKTVRLGHAKPVLATCDTGELYAFTSDQLHESTIVSMENGNAEHRRVHDDR